MTHVQQAKSPLSPDFADIELDGIQSTRKAMLLIVCLTRSPHLLQRNPDSEQRLKRLLYHLCHNDLHPRGTVIVAMPTPFHHHAGHVAGTFGIPSKRAGVGPGAFYESVPLCSFLTSRPWL